MSRKSFSDKFEPFVTLRNYGMIIDPDFHKSPRDIGMMIPHSTNISEWNASSIFGFMTTVIACQSDVKNVEKDIDIMLSRIYKKKKDSNMPPGLVNLTKRKKSKPKKAIEDEWDKQKHEPSPWNKMIPYIQFIDINTLLNRKLVPIPVRSDWYVSKFTELKQNDNRDLYVPPLKTVSTESLLLSCLVPVKNDPSNPKIEIPNESEPQSANNDEEIENYNELDLDDKLALELQKVGLPDPKPIVNQVYLNNVLTESMKKYAQQIDEGNKARQALVEVIKANADEIKSDNDKLQALYDINRMINDELFQPAVVEE